MEPEATTAAAAATGAEGGASRLRSSIRLTKHETLVIRRPDGMVRLWIVAGPHVDGWLLEPLDGSDERRLFLHREIFEAYVTGRIKVLGRVSRRLDVEEEMRVRRAWDGAPPWARAVAERRYLMLRACREQRGQFKSMAEAFTTVPARIVAKHGARWAEEDRKLRPARAACEGGGDSVLVASPTEESAFSVPCERTMWEWHRRCDGPDADMRRLLPRWQLRGDTRSLFDAAMVELMDEVIRNHLLKPPPKAVKLVYEEIFEPEARRRLGMAPRTLNLPDGCVGAGVVTLPIAPAPDLVDAGGDAGSGDAGDPAATAERGESRAADTYADGGEGDEAGTGGAPARRMNDYPSQVTFWRRYSKVRSDAKTKAHKGHRAVRLEFGTFDEAEAPPFYLHQVEVDHSFINMNVKCDVSGRVLGRPWLTAIRERRTKVILGLHVSFLPPSWMTLSRAIAHSIWPKDLSGFPGLDRQWFCHGVYDWMLTDRGLEFLGDGLRQTGRLIGFEIGNLAGFSPWLKGGLERWFRTMKGQVFSYRDGTSAWRAVKHYDGRQRTTMTLAELKAELVRWVVDKYHYKEHGSLGMPPADRWAMEVASHGPPKPVADFFDLRRLFCRIETRSIQNHGIDVDGLVYGFARGSAASDVLGRLRGRSGGNCWRIMIDPFDLRSIFLEDPAAGVTEDTWIEIPCTRPELAVNVTQPQHELHKMLARLSAPGERITEAMLLRAKDGAEKRLLRLGKSSTGTAARLARYRDDGSFLTPVRLTLPPPALVVQQEADWGEAEFDARTGAAIGTCLAPSARTGDAEGPDAPRPPGETPGAASPTSGGLLEGMPATTDADYESLMAELMKEMQP